MQTNLQRKQYAKDHHLPLVLTNYNSIQQCRGVIFGGLSNLWHRCNEANVTKISYFIFDIIENKVVSVETKIL
jgi:hypothetical protein